MTAGTVPNATAPLSASAYAVLTDAVLASVEATLDAWLQDDLIDIDSHRSGGLLEMHFPNGTTLVLNTQPPLQELWLAARSGGFHFKYAGGAWRSTRDGGELFEILSACATEQGGQALRFEPA